MRRTVLLLLIACSNSNRPAASSARTPPDPALYVGLWQVTTTLKTTTCDTAGARPGDVHVGTWRMNVTAGRLAVVNDDSPRDDKDEVQGPTIDENGKHRIVLRSYERKGTYSDRPRAARSRAPHPHAAGAVPKERNRG